jgi:ornithine cyclodeaminase
MTRVRLAALSVGSVAAGVAALTFLLGAQARWLRRARRELERTAAMPTTNEAATFQANSRAAVAEQRVAVLERALAQSDAARGALEERVAELRAGPIHLSDRDVRALLTASEARAVQRAAFAASAQRGRVDAPARTIIDAPQHDGCTLFKPAYIARDNGGAELGIKVVAVRPHNAARTPALATIPATVLVLDDCTGAVTGIVDATFLTAQRTAAGSAVATSLLRKTKAPTPPTAIVVFGAGLQGAAHLAALRDLHATIDDVVVVNRSAPRAEALLAGLDGKAGLRRAIFVPSADRAAVAAAVARADIVVTATNASAPLFDGAALKAGAHIIAVGGYTAAMRELDAACVARCAVVVDTPHAWDAGDLAQLGAEGRAAVDCGTLGELVLAGFDSKAIEKRLGVARAAALDCTLFKSVGVAFQDVAAGAAVLRAYRRRSRRAGAE